jgi:hypothetical protein
MAVAACGYAVAAVVWLTFGDTLPGGRWFAVHLFTLGVLSNLIVALTDHFARTLVDRAGPDQLVRRFVAFNAGAILLLGFPPGLRYPLIAGAVVVTATVAWLGIDLHRLHRRHPDHRFAFVVLGYRYACVAFVVGAVLGALLGARLISGPWYGAARVAHLHVNILGWGGLTVLTTVVFFGPTMMGTEMGPRAGARAAWALRVAAAGLAVSVGAQLLTGADPGAVWPRSVAASGLAAFAAGATVIVWEVLRSGRGARRSTPASMIRMAGVWFVAVVWADAAAFATGELRVLDVLGAALIVAVLGQAILAALNHLTPAVWGAPGERAAMGEQLERFGPSRVVVLNSGAVIVVLTGLASRTAGDLGAVLIRFGWLLVAAAVLAHVAVIAGTAARGLQAR